MSNKVPKILIVEDEPDIREILKIFMTSLGYETLIAENGKIALEKIQGEDINVVISDLMMPHVSGMMLLEELRRSGFTNPFIFVTAYPSHEASVQALRLGAFDFLEKPFDGAQVRNLVKEAVKISLAEDNFSKLVKNSYERPFVEIARQKQSARFNASDESQRKQVTFFVGELIKQMPICEKSVTGLMNEQVQKWETGYLMRSMQAFMASSNSLGLYDIYEKSAELCELAMQARLDPSIISKEFVDNILNGLSTLKSLATKLTSLSS